jgi:hypothetical protein
VFVLENSAVGNKHVEESFDESQDNKHMFWLNCK